MMYLYFIENMWKMNRIFDFHYIYLGRELLFKSFFSTIVKIVKKQFVKYIVRKFVLKLMCFSVCNLTYV